MRYRRLVFHLAASLTLAGCDYIFRLDPLDLPSGSTDASVMCSQERSSMKGSAALLLLAACGTDGGNMLPDADTTGSGCDGGGCGIDAAVAVSSCDPLEDNDFDGPGASLTRSGSACAAGQGCYGYPHGVEPRTTWACATDLHPTLQHRSQPPEPVQIDSCAQGYIPIVKESYTVSTVTCVAMCKPGNAYSGNPGTQYPAGQAPHRCNSVDARGAFNETAGGDHCMYSWKFEKTPAGKILTSPTSDTVGFCLDHAKYKWDSNFDGFINGSDAFWPACDTLPLSAPGALSAADLGCVDSSLSGLGTARILTEMDDLRVLNMR